MLRRHRFGSIILLSCLQIPAALAAINFHIDAGNAALTLNEFSRQSDVQVLFDFVVINQLLTHSIKGEMEVDEALEALLSDTDMTYDYVNTRTVAVVLRTKIDSDALSRALRGFEFLTQSWPEDAGPRVKPLTVEIVGAGNQDYIAAR